MIVNRTRTEQQDDGGSALPAKIRRWLAGALACTALCLGLAASPVWAMNWEGHDDWFLDGALIEDFTRSLPPPIAKPMPKCSERELEVRANAYEQIPISGLNCRKGRKEQP